MQAYFDGHCDTLSACLHLGWSLHQNEGQLDLQRLSGIPYCAQVFAMFCDPKRLDYDAEQLFGHLTRQHDFFLEQVRQHSDLAAHCRTAADIRAANNRGRIAAVLSIEAADQLACDPDRLELAAEWGVRFVNLTWNRANLLSGTNCEDPERGLSSLGRDFVRQMQELDLYADVSHLSDAGFWDLIRITRKPVIATHSDARAICPHPRNLTDDQFRAIRDTGGVVGLNYYADFVGPDDGSFTQLLRHADHFLELGGENVLALGGDLDGCDPLCAGMRGVQDLERMRDAFRRHGYDDALLQKLFFDNWLRLLES